MSGRETGRGRGESASYNVKITRNACNLFSFHSMLVQFHFTSQNAALTNLIASYTFLYEKVQLSGVGTSTTTDCVE